MNIKKMLQKIILIIDSLEQPKKAKKASPFWDSTRENINTAFNILFIGILVLYIPFWIGLFITYRNSYYFSFLGKDSTELFLIFTPVVWLSIVIWVLQENPSFVKHIYEDLIAPNRFYKLFSGWIYKTSKIFFEKIVFPNIDLIEPGLTGQATESFPEIVIYSDESTKTTDHINTVTRRLVLIASLSYFLFIVFLCILSLFMVLLPGTSEGILGVMVVILIVSLPLYFVLISHPASLISRRRQAFLKEFRRIEEEKWLQRRIDQVKKDSNVLIDDYSLRLNEIKSIFYQELKKLGDVNKKIVITQELVERTRNLVKNNEDPIRLLLRENQDLQEEQEKKKYWKDKIIDATIGFIVGVITTIILANP